jgi:hypothetical protein
MSTTDTNTSAAVEPVSATTDPVTAQAAPTTKASGKKKFRWRPALIILGALLLIFVIIPRAFHAWHTVSTDDAYVNSYVTFDGDLEAIRLRVELNQHNVDWLGRVLSME